MKLTITCEEIEGESESQFTERATAIFRTCLDKRLHPEDKTPKVNTEINLVRASYLVRAIGKGYPTVKKLAKQGKIPGYIPTPYGKKSHTMFDVDVTRKWLHAGAPGIRVGPNATLDLKSR